MQTLCCVTNVLIEGPTGVQLLVDGGSDKSVLRGLGETLPFYDRKIDAVLATHPDSDHIGGLPDVFERYEVGVFIESGVLHETIATKKLEEAVQKENSKKVTAKKGMRFLLGGGAYVDVLFPDKDVSNFESNTGSVIVRVVYGEIEFMLTGDSPISIERYLVVQKINLESDVLKAGHHGSKTSTLKQFLDTVSPDYVVVSAGKNNRYGHPHEIVVDRVKNYGAKILSTAEVGTITFYSNGRNLKVKD